MTPRGVRMASLVLLCVAALALAGCAGRAAAEAVETDRVDLPPSYRFEPPVIQVTAGTTVIWTNDDHFTHSVSVQDGGVPLLNLPPGQSGSLTFDRPGEYDYICTYHATDMKGQVIVTAP